jgi:hypothetical protein
MEIPRCVNCRITGLAADGSEAAVRLTVARAVELYVRQGVVEGDGEP